MRPPSPLRSRARTIPSSFLMKKSEGSRAPTGAGAEAPHPVIHLASGPIFGKRPKITGQ